MKLSWSFSKKRKKYEWMWKDVNTFFSIGNWTLGLKLSSPRPTLEFQFFYLTVPISWNYRHRLTYPAIFLIIRPLQVKVTMKYHFLSTSLVVKQNHDNYKCWPKCGKFEPSYPADGNVKWHNHFGNSLQFPKMLNIDLPHDLAILYLSIYSVEIITYLYKNLYLKIHSYLFTKF